MLHCFIHFPNVGTMNKKSYNQVNKKFELISRIYYSAKP
ncbi:Hypothetical protein ABZS17G119_02894 [Kosakonia cowanii]